MLYKIVSILFSILFLSSVDATAQRLNEIRSEPQSPTLPIRSITAGSAPSVPTSFVEDGKSGYVILIDEVASETTRFAAQQLNHYVKQMTPTSLPIVREAKPNDLIISIGETEISKGLGIRFAERYQDDDQFVIVNREGSLFLLGATQRANLYAVYHLLEYWGCRWFTPVFDFSQELSAYIPRKTSLVLPVEDIHEKPSLRYRMALCIPGFWKADAVSAERLSAIIDWMGKQRLNVVGIHIKQYENVPRKIIQEIAKRGLYICAEGHSWAYFISMKENEFQRKYCSNSEKATKYLIGKITDFKKQYKEIKILGPWGEDNSKWCLCGNCLGIESPSSRAVMFYKRLWKQLKGIDGDMRLLMIGYQSFLFPPEKTEFPSDTLVYVCPINRDHGKPLWNSSSKKNALFIKAIDTWKRLGFSNNLIHYTYYRKHAWHSLPVNTPFHMAEEMAWSLSKGFVGASTYFMDQDWLAYDVQHLMYAKLCWEANANADSILKDYMKTFFGNSWKHMYDMHREFEILTYRLHGGGHFGYSIRGLSKNSLATLSNAIEKLEQILRSIEMARNGCVAKPGCLELLESREYWVRHWLLKLRASRDFKTKKTVSATTFDDLLQFLLKSCPEGLVYKGLINNKQGQMDKSKL